MAPELEPQSTAEPEVSSDTGETYRVTSRNCALGPFWSTVSADQLVGLHVEALIAAGHLTSTSTEVTDPGGAADPNPDAPKGN